MDEQRVKSIIESILFVSEKPITVKDIVDVLGEGFDTKTVRKVLEDMVHIYESRKGGILLREVAGGFQLYTNPENSEYLRRLIDVKPFKLSRAALETLAIIAYRQPITRAEIDDLRGVDSSGALRVLVERRLVRIVGKKDEPGRPFLYGTTKEFLEFFDLKSLAELPTLKDLQQVAREFNEESGVASGQLTQSSMLTEQDSSQPQVVSLKDNNLIRGGDEGGKEEEPDGDNREEIITLQLEEALKRVEMSNKAVKDNLGLNELADNHPVGDDLMDTREQMDTTRMTSGIEKGDEE
ncbi:MAG: SMC-Scp complex subunit ScpB [Deltaproteobacteria bacterium]|nr:SMC-Scp complex subunit ScpB [Deltaproteobacteria bacterium]